MTARSLIGGLLSLVVACGGGKSGSTTPTDPAGSGNTSGGGGGSSGGGAGGGSSGEQTGAGIAFDVEPPDAMVAIDDEPRGKASELDAVVGLAAGLHTFVITMQGYKTYRAEFSVTDKVEKFVVKLEKQ